MEKRVTLSLLVVAIGLLGVFVWLNRTPVACAEDDFQYWSKYEMAKELGPYFEIFYEPEFRLRDDASDFFYHEHRQGLRVKPFKFLQISFNYLFARNQPARGQPRWEHRGELDVTPKVNWRAFTFSIRGRAELREVQGSSGEEEWRFRVMPKAAYKLNLWGYAPSPYVANDLFYDVERDAWNQNRMFLGVGFPLGNLNGIRPSVDFYYMLQSLRSVRDDWNSNHIFGTKFSVRL